MFERPQHRRIAQVLEGLDANLLLRNRCLFGGGTVIALAHGAYRESVGVAFVCSSVDGYRNLRSLVSAGGLDTLFTSPVPQLRVPKIDQYGIRGAMAVDEIPVKFEIVFEGRVALADPQPQDKICGAWTLAFEDRVATKLMANSDRWADDSVMSRDLIDLSMLTDSGILPREGVAKAKHAYGESIVSDFGKAKDHLLGRAKRLERCIEAMNVSVPVEEMRIRIERLRLNEDQAGPPKASRRRKT